MILRSFYSAEMKRFSDNNKDQMLPASILMMAKT